MKTKNWVYNDEIVNNDSVFDHIQPDGDAALQSKHTYFEYHDQTQTNMKVLIINGK